MCFFKPGVPGTVLVAQLLYDLVVSPEPYSYGDGGGGV